MADVIMEQHSESEIRDLYGEHCRKLGIPFGDIIFAKKADEKNP
jgi:hypothetical protein